MVLIWMLLLLFSLPSVWALMMPGYFYTHDGAFHLVRLAHFYNELMGGQFPVRWAHNLAFGFGYPIFNYLYPLPYYLGSLLHLLGLSFGESIKMIILLSTLGSSILMFYLLRCHFGNLPSFVGALFYLYTPFRFVTNYITGQIGTSVIFFLIPLNFITINKLLTTKKLIYIPMVAISFAGILLSHNISILIFLPVIGTYAIYMLLITRVNKKSMFSLFLATCLGAGLAGFFVLPAFFEKGYVKIGTGQTVNYRDHWPTFKQLIYSKWGYGFSEIGGENDGLSFQVGIGQWTAILFSTFLIIGQKLFSYRLKNLSIAFVFLPIFIVSIFLMLSLSEFIWSNLKIMHNIQQPWRLLAIVPLCAGCMVAWVVAQKPKWWLVIFFIIIVLYANRNYLRTWEIKRYSDSHYLDNLYTYRGPPDIAWEYLPVWVDVLPDLSTDQKIQVEQQARIYNISQDINHPLIFDINTKNAITVILNKFYFPNWEIKVDNNKSVIIPTAKTGLISFNLQPGYHLVAARIVNTTLENFANWLSIISFLFWLVLIYTAVFTKHRLQ